MSNQDHTRLAGACFPALVASALFIAAINKADGLEFEWFWVFFLIDESNCFFVKNYDCLPKRCRPEENGSPEKFTIKSSPVFF